MNKWSIIYYVATSTLAAVLFTTDFTRLCIGMAAFFFGVFALSARTHESLIKRMEELAKDYK